jgi:3-deoxy-manno-octulosonate cytidylyltransferase (CMP-KDO synthetase)
MLTLCQCAGDEPFINEEPLAKLIETQERSAKQVTWPLMREITKTKSTIHNVKVVTIKRIRIFSRSAIPIQGENVEFVT